MQKEPKKDPERENIGLGWACENYCFRAENCIFGRTYTRLQNKNACGNITHVVDQCKKFFYAIRNPL